MITKDLRSILLDLKVPVDDVLRQELNSIDARFQMECSIRQRLENQIHKPCTCDRCIEKSIQFDKKECD